MPNIAGQAWLVHSVVVYRMSLADIAAVDAEVRRNDLRCKDPGEQSESASIGHLDHLDDDSTYDCGTSVERAQWRYVSQSGRIYCISIQ